MTSGTKANSSIVVMLEIRHNGKQVVVPVAVDGFGKQNGILFDSNAITSVYGKNYSISKVLYDAIMQESNGQFRLYYLDKNKATALLQEARVPMPKNPASHNGGFIHSLADLRSPVKSRFSDVTETQQFKRWFGDWQKHPQNASKVVNSDGTPKIMYHGTSVENGDFYVFDASKAVKKGGLGLKAMGKGNYFTAKQLNGTERYGSRVIAAYLDIKKPFVYSGGASIMEQVGHELGINTDGMNHTKPDMRKAMPILLISWKSPSRNVTKRSIGLKYSIGLVLWTILHTKVCSINLVQFAEN